MAMTSADKRNYLTADEELRLAALKLAQETLEETGSEVVERAKAYHAFLTDS